MFYLIFFVVVIYLIVEFFSAIIHILPILLKIATIVAAGYGLYRLVRYLLKERYFKSKEFLEHKHAMLCVLREYNEIAGYVRQLPNYNHFVADKSRYDSAHLARYENTSLHNYQRDKYERDLDNEFVYSASLNIVRRASEEPIKYLCKYFNIDATEENLNQLERIGENISRIENTVNNLYWREQEIKESFNPPNFILKYYEDELYERLSLDVPHVEVEYAEYVFEYVSAGGNSSQRTTIEFNSETVEATARYVAEQIRKKKSAKYQRSLMTNKLRNYIKERDNYTCQMCGASAYEHYLLLLEVDHIIPISRGGLSVPENLQTLCWKCNRSKSNRLPLRRIPIH